MALSLYVDRVSPLHARHPVAKVLAMTMLFVATFVLDHPAYIAPLTLLVLAGTAWGRAFVNLYRMRWILLPVLVFTTVIWAIFYPARASGVVDRGEALLFGLGMALKLETFLLTGFLFLATTSVEEFSWALTRLGLPYRAGFVFTLAFRLVPVFLEAALTVVDAQRCRGLDLGAGTLRQRIARYVPVIVPVFIGGLRRADQMAFALEVRGFGSGRPRTDLPRPPFGPRDALLVAMVAAVMAVYLGLWMHDIGRIVPG